MRARVLFFGMLKEVVGFSSEEIDLPEGASLGSVFERYAALQPKLRKLAPSIVAARNQEFANLSTPVADGDELAFLPPVSGGSESNLELVSGDHFFRLTRRAINTKIITRELLNGAEGAVVTFEGTVRNNTKGRPTLYLDYEGYEAMALKVLGEIGCQLARQFDISRVAIVHRLGRMLIGETSVAVIVTAPHRQPAFEAALEGINRLKKIVPIWKKEHFVDGEVWVEGEWASHVQVVG
jgi:molybdopterin synthase catalytic subunit